MDTRAVFPGQVAESRAHPIQATSDLMLWLGKRSSAILEGRFPFPDPNGAFVAYVKSVAPLVPVSLLPHRFRHWIPTKGPSDFGYKRRKVDQRLLGKVLRCFVSPGMAAVSAPRITTPILGRLWISRTLRVFTAGAC